MATASQVAAGRHRLLVAPRAGAVSPRRFELMPVMPRLKIEQACQKLAATSPTAGAAVKLLEETGIAIELTGQKRFGASAIGLVPSC